MRHSRPTSLLYEVFFLALAVGFFTETFLAAGLAVAFLVIAYGFISLAIDKGSVFQYAVGIFFVGWAVVQLNRARKALFS